MKPAVKRTVLQLDRIDLAHEDGCPVLVGWTEDRSIEVRRPLTPSEAAALIRRLAGNLQVHLAPPPPPPLEAA